MLEFLVKSPHQCTSIEIGAFTAFVRASGEVVVQGLSERIRSATALVFVRNEGLIIGIAALKNPNVGYRSRVSAGSHLSLTGSDFPYELGWVFVSPEHRGQGLSLHLSQAALSVSKGAGVFATSRIDNAAMQKQLLKLGFVAVGNIYVSGRGGHSLQVFTRNATTSISA